MRGGNRGTKRGGKIAAFGGGYEQRRGRGSKHSGKPY
jgi:phage-related protein